MTNEEAIKTIKIAIAEAEFRDYPKAYSTAFKKAVKVLENQIPKKPIKSDEKIRYCEVFKCPNCSFEFSGRVLNYCYRCGQPIDWSERNG